MFALPHLNVADFETMADWTELSVLCGDVSSLSKADVGDIFKDASLFGTEQGDLPKGDFSLRDKLDFSSDDELDGLTDLIWSVMRRRYGRSRFPFSISGEELTREISSWELAPAFTMLLLSDVCRRYVFRNRDVALTADGVSGRLFEKIVESSTRGLFSGEAVRFGWVPDSDWPRPIEDRIRVLGERLSLDAENLEGKFEPKEKDKGLDVVARLEFGSGQHACPYFLIQCAVGKHWNRKRGEPSIEDWNDVFQWFGPLMRVVAMPWRLESPWDYKRCYRKFGAVILDRPRLNRGRPDQALDVDTSDKIRCWCRRALKIVPVIG